LTAGPGVLPAEPVEPVEVVSGLGVKLGEGELLAGVVFWLPSCVLGGEFTLTDGFALGAGLGQGDGLGLGLGDGLGLGWRSVTGWR
jgi:hypothetical protein